MSEKKHALSLFTKSPQPGITKTRLTQRFGGPLTDAEAAQFYKMLDEAPEFAIFLKNLEALKVMLQQRTTVVLPMDTAPFNLLVEAPDPNAWQK